MIKLTFELPDEIVMFLEEQGHAPEAYIELMLWRPLRDKYKEYLIKKEVKKVAPSAEQKVTEAQGKMKTSRQHYQTFTLVNETDPSVEKEFTLETDSKGKILTMPKGYKLK